MNIIVAVQEIQKALRAEDFEKAGRLLAFLRKTLPPGAAWTVDLIEAQYYSAQSQFGPARALLSRVLARDPPEAVKAAAWGTLAGIEMREGPSDSTAELLRDALVIARRVGDHGLAGDTAFNLATLRAQAGDTQGAIALWKEARESYTAGGRTHQVIDCVHVIATAARLEGIETEDDLDAMREALTMAIELGDLAAISRIAGDLARTHYCRFAEKKAEAELELAYCVLPHMYLAEDRLWTQARRGELSIGARIERAEQMFNNIETTILVCLAKDRPLEAYAASSLAKGKILRDEVGRRTQAEIERFRLRDPRFSSMESEQLAVCAANFANDEIAKGDGAAIATIETFALASGKLFMHIDATGCTEPFFQSAMSPWPERLPDSLSARLIRGRGQAHEALKLQAHILSEMERCAGAAPFLFDAGKGVADVGQRETLREEGKQLERALEILGKWFFPEELLTRLAEQDVRHVFLSPDPRLFSLPWLALITGNGKQVVDQPWALSLLPSSLSMYDVLRRRRTALAPEVAILAPDEHLNSDLGGNQEIAAITALFPGVTVYKGGDATLARLDTACVDAGWVHLRAHGIRCGESFLPNLFDGPWKEPLSLEKPGPVVVSTSCRTGAAVPRGQDVFGMVEVAERADLRTLIVPIVSVDGHATFHWMRSFYSAMAEGTDVGKAVQQASKELRDALVHPTFWASFICVGDHGYSPAAPATEVG